MPRNEILVQSQVSREAFDQLNRFVYWHNRAKKYGDRGISRSSIIREALAEHMAKQLAAHPKFMTWIQENGTAG